MLEKVARRFREVAPRGVDFCALRIHDERSSELAIRTGVVQPYSESRDVGAMVMVHADGGLGYAGTSDLSASGIARALEVATRWAKETARYCVVDTRAVSMPHPEGRYQTPVDEPVDGLSVAARLELLQEVAAELGRGGPIVDWSTSLWAVTSESGYFTTDGGEVSQTLHHVIPDVEVVAYRDGLALTRSFGGRGRSYQGGVATLRGLGLAGSAARLADEALLLLDAPDCPSGTMDLLVAPDQMLLQIHESIGHPLELDRILGDERNYAGRSFVSLDMFGSYQYGSSLLNVAFDPSHPEQLASYGFDDEGARAEKTWVIKDGVLQQPLGSVLSQARAGTGGVAGARATSWNRPPIDRMANLNLEPGESSFDDLVRQVERGVYVETNTSWSIDDSRNKFQFGCELGREIKDGELGRVVKKPNYRGVSATFWRSLKGVGDADTYGIHGTPFCGKGEPNQIIRVGHASPACLFADVEVFGGDS